MRTEEVKRAIDYLLGIWGDYGRHERAVEVLIAYIENLENEVTKEPCEDAVSTQAVLDAIKRISLGQTDAVKVSTTRAGSAFPSSTAHTRQPAPR